MIVVRAHTVRAHVRKRSTNKAKRTRTSDKSKTSIKKVVIDVSNDDDDHNLNDWVKEDMEMAMALSMEQHEKKTMQHQLRVKLERIEDALSSSNVQPTVKQQAIMSSLAAKYQASINSNGGGRAACSNPSSSSKTTIKKEPKTCCICISAIGKLIPARVLACAHTFHHHCIEQWINTNPSCPECRCPID